MKACRTYLGSGDELKFGATIRDDINPQPSANESRFDKKGIASGVRRGVSSIIERLPTQSTESNGISYLQGNGSEESAVGDIQAAQRQFRATFETWFPWLKSN